MKDKKLIAAITAASLTLGAFALTGCSKAEEGAADDTPAETSSTDESTTKPE